MKTFTLCTLFITITLNCFSQTPTITSFTPTSAATGRTVTITGTNFTSTTSVTFGGTPASSFAIVSATQITAVVGSGTSGSIVVTRASGSGSKTGFYYLPLSGIITDFGGFWSTTTASPNSTNPTTSHNLLAFTYNGTTYSTGANNAILTSNSVTYTSGSFKAIPVAGLAGTNPSGGSTYIALAKNVDGNASTGDAAAVSNYTIKKVLTDGTNGLDLGTGVTNLPVSAILKYNIGNIVTAKIADAEPDIIITQIADPSTGNDVFQFVDASGTLVGNTVTQDMTLLNPLGTYVLDLFNLSPNTPYNTASVYTTSSSNVTRQIRLVAFKLSDFGITSGNSASVKGLQITPSGNSDYAFIAYNANALNLPPSISQNSAETNTSVCSAGTANLAVIADPAKGGTLSYTWERSVNGGTTWTAVTNGGNVSGATTNKLIITSPTNNDQYRATVAESGSSLTNTSDPFTITIVSPAAPTAVTVSGTTTTCINNSVIVTSAVTGGSNLYYQWQTNTSGSYADISGANLNNYEPPVDVAGVISYKVKVSSGNGCTSLTSSNAATITVSATTVAGSTSGSATVCTGTNSTTLTLSGNMGSVVKWQYSTDNFSSDINDVANTTTSLTATNLTATTQYRAVVQSGACASAISTVSTIIVTASVGGSISGSATVCTGTNSTTLTLSGNTGSVVKWQSSTDNFATVISDIANATTTLTATNLTATTQYRAVIQYGSCATANSLIATITVNASVGGSVSGSATVCTGTNSTTLTLSGNTGSVVKWQSSTDNFATVINDIANATTTLTATNLNATTQYRAVVQSGVCASANSSTATVTVNPISVGGSISGSATVCTGTNSTTLTLSGYTGSVTKWQSSTDNFVSDINDIANTTATLTATNLTATTQYRAVVQSGVCASANSSTATITVSATTVGGSVSGGATVCTGTNSTALTLSGYTGNVTKWQSSTDNFVSVINDIVNTTATLTATNLSATTQYRAVAQSGVCASANSSTATVTVNPTSVGGSISGSATICTGTNSTTLTLSGNTGSIVKWQSSTDNFSSVINDVANTTTTLTATNLTATTQYRAVVQSGVCATANSSTATVTVNPASVGGSISGSATVCTGTNSTTLTLSGYTGSVIKWQSSTDNFSSVIDDVANTTTTLTAINLTTTMQYRAVVQSGACASANSSTVTVTVNPTSNGGAVSGSATVCTGTNSTTLTLSGYTGSIIKWQSSTDNFVSVINDVANTTATLTATNLTTTTQYRVVVQSGVCTTANSSTATVTVNPASVGGSISGSATVCTGTNSTTLTLSGYTGSIIKWQSSTDNFSSVINDVANTTTTLTAINLTTTMQYRAVVQSGACASANSSTATVTVNSSSVGGTTSGGGRECQGTNSRTLDLSGYTGSVIKWQYSIDNFAGDINDIANTTNSLTVNDLSVTTKYRAIVQNGVCAADTSSSVRIRVVSTGEWIGGTSGDWNEPSNWCGGVPAPTADVYVPVNTTIYIQSADVTIHSVNIHNNASLVMQNGYNLNIAAGGSLISSGTFDGSASTGVVSFLGNGSISGTITLQNIETYGALDFGSASTISGNFTIQPGGSVTGNPPLYTCPSSNLIYSAGGVYNRGIEWLSTSSGQGYPSNVTVQNNTIINFPSLGDGYICNDLTIDSGSALSQDYAAASAALYVGRNVTINGTLSLGSNYGGNISLAGNWTRNAGGIFINNQREVIFNGTGNSVITAPASVVKDINGAFGGETFYDLNIAKTDPAATVSLGAPVSIINEINFAQGIFDLVNSDVTMVSNAAATSHIAPLPTVAGVVAGVEIRYGGTEGSGTGKFVVQRYLSIGSDPSSRRWRLLTVPFSSTDAPTVSSGWQEGVSNADKDSPVNPWPGYGTTITKSKIYNSSDGYDQGSTNNPSLYYFSNSAWSVLPTTNTEPITDHEGYMLFARGNRSIVVSTPSINANSTTLEPKGKILIGDVNKSMITGLQTLGNPYASAIDFSKIAFNNYTIGTTTYNTTPGSSDGLGITYYIWDPLTDGTNGLGKFITCSSNGDGTYMVTSNTGGIPSDGTVPSGTAFIMSSDNSSASLTFHEADKLNSNGQIISRPMTPIPVATFASNLYVINGALSKLADGVISAYGNFNNQVDGQDAISISTFNTKQSLSISRNGVALSVERRSRITVNDTIFLALKNLNAATYKFQFSPLNFDPALTAVLEDKFTGISKSISITGSTDVQFNVTSDEASFATDRFRIVFRPSATLPVTFREVKAYQQNKSIAVQWTVETQLNITKYEVEKSVNGISFIKVNTIVIAGSVQQTVATYNWLDVNISLGDNFYRIKYYNNDGSFAYSKIVKVTIGSDRSFITVYPNPVTDGNVTLQLSNMPAGAYHLRILNSLGNTVDKNIIIHSGGSSFQIIPQRNLISGSYQLEITGPDNKVQIVKIIVQTGQ